MVDRVELWLTSGATLAPQLKGSSWPRDKNASKVSCMRRCRSQREEILRRRFAVLEIW
jgi:hypothetical protein